MSFSQKVTRLMRENGMSKATLAKDAGIPYTTLDSMLKRETDTARLTTVFRIADALGTSVRSLVFDGDEAEVSLSAEEKKILELYSLLDDRGRNTVLSLMEKEADHCKTPAGEQRAFPIYDAPAAAGEPLPVLTEEKREEICHVHAIPKGAAFGIRLSGDSMEPLFSDGDLVYVSPEETLNAGEIGVFLLNGESLCKKLLNLKGETYLVSLNPKYDPIPVLETDELKLVGRVIVE